MERSIKKTKKPMARGAKFKKLTEKGSPESLSTFIYKILKRVNPEKGISNRAMAIMNSLMQELYNNIMKTCQELPQFTKTITLDARTIQTAVRLALPTEVAKCSVAEGTKAIVKMTAVPEGGLSSSKGLSRSLRAGLTFPVGRYFRAMKQKWKGPVSTMAPVYLAAVCEYVCCEVLELADKLSNQTHKVRIIPRHISLAIRGDADMDRLFPGTVASGGVVPNIHSSLIPLAARQASAEGSGGEDAE